MHRHFDLSLYSSCLRIISARYIAKTCRHCGIDSYVYYLYSCSQVLQTLHCMGLCNALYRNPLPCNDLDICIPILAWNTLTMEESNLLQKLKFDFILLPGR